MRITQVFRFQSMCVRAVECMIDQRLKPLHEVSHLVSALGDAQRDNWRMGVYTLSEYRDVVATAAREFFGVRKHKQFRLDELIT